MLALSVSSSTTFSSVRPSPFLLEPLADLDFLNRLARLRDFQFMDHVFSLVLSTLEMVVPSWEMEP